jgi:translocation and assembly module TamB
MSRAAKTALGVLAGMVTIAALALVALVVVTQTDWGREQVRRIALEQLEAAAEGEVEIGRVEGDLLRRIRFVEVAIRDLEGRPFVRADTIATGFSLWGLLRQRIVLRNLRLVNAHVVLDQPPGEEWNYQRIFPVEPPVEPDPPPGWGDWVLLQDVELVNTRVTVRSEWEPSDTLSPAQRARAIEEALSEDTRPNVQRVPGGFQNVMDFRQLHGRLPRARIADPGEEQMVFEVASLSGIARPFRPPVAEVRDLSGEVRLSEDSLWFREIEAVLPGSRLRGGGVYALKTAEYLLDLRGDPVAFDDLRWLYPPLPEQGGGSLRLALHQREFTTLIVAEDANLQVGESRLAGRFGLVFGDTVRFRDTDLRFAELDTRLIERLVPELELPRHGRLTGEAALTGPTAAMQVDADVRFADERVGLSRVRAVGTVGMEDYVRFDDLLLRLEPLRVELVREQVPQLPPGGAIEGAVRLTGSPADVLQLDGDLTLRDPRTGPSRVLASGAVALNEVVHFRDLRVRLDPLQLDLLREQLPDLPPGATVSGPVRLNGSTAALLQVDGDLTVRDSQTGESRLLAHGEIGVEPEIRFRDLDLRFDPLQVALVSAVGPEVPIGGVLAGTARLNGYPAARLAARVDLVHLERGERSQVAGDVEIAMREEWAVVDLRLQPLSLRTVGRFAPEAGLRGSVAGAVRARGDLRNLALATDLRLPDGGELALRGTLDLVSEQPGYDLTSQLHIFNLAVVTERAPAVTSLTGAIEARGRGFDPATMRAILTADLVGAEVDELAAEEVRLRLAIAEGLARIDSSLVRLPAAEGFADGSFGLVAHRSGELAYRVEVDSLHAFAPWVPAADTGVVELRPVVREAAVAEARAEAERLEEARQVEWLATGIAPPAEPIDTAGLTQVPRDSLAGSVHTAGILRGNLERFDLSGRAELQEVLYQGNYVGAGMADYTLLGLGTPELDIELDASLHPVLAAGFAFDSADARVRYRGERFGAGEAVIAAYQDDETDFRADVEFALSLERSELRLQDLELRFDTVHWRTTRPGLISWDATAVEVDTLELQSDAGGRILVDGRVPVEGTGLELVVHDLEIAQLMGLLQEDTEARGLLSLNAHVQGTLRSPRFEGQLGLVDGWLERNELPEIRAGFSYADAALTADAQLLRRNLVLARIEGALPLDLALADQEGPRLLDAPLALDIRADSLPLDALPAFTDQIEDLRGRLIGEISVRGSPNDPILDGLVNLDLASFGVTALGVRFEDVAGTLRMDGQALLVDSLVAWSGGPVRITGELDLANLTEPGFDLQVTAQDARVLDNEHGRIWLDADVEVVGPFDAVRATGQAHVLRGVLYIPETRPHVMDLDDPEMLATLDPILVAERDALVDPVPVLENLEADIELFISPDTWVRSVEANVEIYTVPEVGPLALRYHGANGLLDLEGTINSDRGDYSFMGRRFQVTRGAAIFAGGGEFDPLLQIAAEHEVRLAGREPLEIRIVISGTATEPTIALESSEQPPIPETDLLSYLAFGRSASSLMQLQGSSLGGQQTGGGPLGGEVAGLATQQLAAVAVNTLVTEFERDAARSLGLDVLHISPADLPAEIARGRFDFANALRGTEIEIGTYIGARLFLAGQARPTLIRPGARVEYRSPGGFVWTTAWEPRFLPPTPTLTPVDPERTSVLGAFLHREWRF